MKGRDTITKERKTRMVKDKAKQGTDSYTFEVSFQGDLKKQAKQEAKDRAAMEKFGLDFESYTEADIRRKNITSAKEIAESLAGSKMYSFGSLFTGSANETFSLELARAQVEQNFILMRQNEEIIRLLKKIAGD